MGIGIITSNFPERVATAGITMLVKFRFITNIL